MIRIKNYVVGDIYTNCYLVEDVDTGRLLVVDPGGVSEELIEDINKKAGKLEYILLTHGHFDHILFVSELKKLFNPSILVSKEEEQFIYEEMESASLDIISKVEPFKVDKFLSDNENIEFGNSTITFLHTPGHTMGSGVYIVDDVMFSGDTLFCQSIGRTDFPNSSHTMMINSINKLKNLSSDYKVLPGHSNFTTLSFEREHNPYF